MASKGGADPTKRAGDDLVDYVKPAVKGAITAGAAAMVGGIAAGFLAVLAPYAMLVGGAVTLIVVDTLWK